MDSARFGLAIVLMIAVIVLTNLLFPPVRTPPTTGADATRVDTARDATPPGPVPTPREAPRDTARAVVGSTAAQPLRADTVVVESPLYRYAFSTAGAALVSGQLKRFASFTADGLVDLAQPRSGGLLRYDLRVDGQPLDISRVSFRAEPARGFVLREGDESRTLRMVGTEPSSGATIELTYRFAPDSYVARVEGRVLGLGDRSRMLVLRMPQTLASHEHDPREDERALAYVVNSRREGIASTRLDKVNRERVEEGPLSWVAVKNKYFLLAAVATEQGSADGFGGLIAQPVDTPNAALLSATVPMGRQEAFGFLLYVGPQEHDRLQAIGSQLEDVNPYGWRVFRPIIRPLGHVITWLLVRMHDVLGFSYGVILILFGILVRIVLWPLNSKAMRAQMRNMEIQPKLKEIQTKYKGNPEQLQKEMLRLYKEEGFNPFGGCLPMLLPFPVLITLFFVFQSTILFRGVSFLWLPDLSRYDPLYILPVVLGVSMFVMQWLSMRSTPQPNPQLKMMMWIMPGMMMIIFLRLASGLNLYYAATTIASVPQQLQIMRERKRVQGRMATQVAAPPSASEGRRRGRAR